MALTFDECVQEISDILTVSGSLPLYINENEIGRIITRAKDWFYINYNRAVESKYYVIPLTEFENPAFKDNRTIVMPDCVTHITRVQEAGGAIRFAGIGKELTIDRLVATELLFNRGIAGELVALTARLAFLDLMRAYYVQDINYGYNVNSKKLVFIGRNPTRDVILKTYVKLEDQFLYNDPYFLKYCAAQGKLSTSRVLGAFDMNMPGGVRLNKDLFSSEGQTELDQVKQEILDQQTADMFLMIS
jgi:hypothetical protein